MNKVLLRNKLDKAGEVILCDNKAKNTGIAIAMARLFNEVSVQKNKPEWSSYFVTMPNYPKILVLTGMFLLVFLSACQNKSHSVSPERKNIIETVFASGYTFNSDEYLVASNTEGFIVKSYVKEGDSVKKGKILFQLSGDVQSYQLNNALANFNDAVSKADPNSPQILSLKTQIEQARIQTNLDKKNFERYSALIKTNAVSQLEYDKIKLQYESSLKNVEILENSLEDLQSSLNLNLKNAENQLKIQREYTNDYFIKSTADGDVLNIYKKQGELVRRGENIAKIGSGNTIIKLFISEEDINRVKVGLLSKIALNTDKYNPVEARITKIYPAFDEAEQSFILEAQFIDAGVETNVLANTQLQSNIIIEQIKNALVIPIEYLSANGTVTLDNGNSVVVKIGIKSGRWVEILEGINDDNKIIIQH